MQQTPLPTGRQDLTVEPAEAADWPGLAAIIETHDGPGGRDALGYWWRRRSQAFRTVRSGDGALVGFCCLIEAELAAGCEPHDDPVVSQWLRHLRREPVGTGDRALFLRRWLARGAGEAPSPEQAACWLDLGRVCLELRPRRVYLALRDPAPYLPVAPALRFRLLDGAATELEAARYHAAMLDCAARPLDVWLGPHPVAGARADAGQSPSPESGRRRARSGSTRTRQ